MFKAPSEQYRSTSGKLATTSNDGIKGVFFIPLEGKTLGIKRIYGYAKCISSILNGFEVVSVQIVNISKEKVADRNPTINELKIVRDHYWEADDRVMMNLNPIKEKEGMEPHNAILFKKIGSIYELPV